MSRIYFHSPSGTAEVSGAERAHCGVTCGDIAVALLAVKFHDDPIRNLLPANSHLLHGEFNVRSFETWFRVGDGALALPGGQAVDLFTVALNTVSVIGDDVLRFMARVHGQCEIHGYIEGPSRAWFADLIERGREEKLLRAQMGWESVVTLLRQRDDEAVVTSYSVCQQFPNGDVTGWRDDRDGEGWYDLPKAEQWARALAAIRESGNGLEWNPDHWQAFRFGDGMTAMDIRQIANGFKSSV
jgi:hypothetical protein